MTLNKPISTVWPYPFWIAHRGAGKLAPENTLAAFKLGAHHGYRMFECDVQLSNDGILFLLHDESLDRTTNGSGLASAQPWSALSLLDAGSWHSADFAGEPLVSFEAVARHCLAHNYFLNLEIKPSPGLEVQTGAALAHAVAKLWPESTVLPLLSSFSQEALAAAKHAQPSIPRAILFDVLYEGWVDAALQLGCVAVVCEHTRWDAVTFASAQQAGLRTLAYTVNTQDTASRLINLGLDGVITDKIDVFIPLKK